MTNTFTFKAPSAEEYALIEAGVMRILFIPCSQQPAAELYEADKPRKFDTVKVLSPSGRKHVLCDHLLTDQCRPGYRKEFGQKPYVIQAVQNMYRLHVKLKEAEKE